MGFLARSLAPPSSHAARKTAAWPELIDRIGACMTLEALAEFEQWLELYPLLYPAAWLESLLDEVELQRESIEAEDNSLRFR